MQAAYIMPYSIESSVSSTKPIWTISAVFERKRRYYSSSTGSIADRTVNLDDLKKLFIDLYNEYNSEGYFQEYFGYDCVDNPNTPGKLGQNVEASVKFAIGKEYLWPVWENIDSYSEEDLFDVIEFLHDHISKPLEGYYHDFSGCGYHYHTFDENEGKSLFRTQINLLLEDYDEGFLINENGEILQAAPDGMDNLLSANIPTKDDNVVSRVNNAIGQFRKYRSSFEDRRHAIRDLADILEYLRPQLKKMITKSDESDLFNIANNFGIRHHNENQRINYDRSIWYSWIFYYYLATIHAALRLIEKSDR